LHQAEFFKSPEMWKEIIKKAWFVPSRFILDDTGHIKPDNYLELAEKWAEENQPQADTTMLAENANPQINIGNEWGWQ